VDSALFWIAAYGAAVALARDEKRYETADALQAQQQVMKRGAQLRWSNYEQGRGLTFDYSAVDFDDDGMD